MGINSDAGKIVNSEMRTNLMKPRGACYEIVQHVYRRGSSKEVVTAASYHCLKDKNGREVSKANLNLRKLDRVPAMSQW